MRTRSILYVTIVLALVAIVCQQPTREPQKPGPLSKEDMVTLKNLVQPYVEAVRKADWASVAAFYTEDAVRMPPDESLLEGRAAILSWLSARPITITDFTLRVADIDGRDDIAYVRGTYSITYAIGEEAEPENETGKWLNIARKQTDGSWLIAVNIWNSDTAIPVKKEPVGEK